MRVVVNRINKKISRIVSHSLIKQDLEKDEFELIITDESIINYFMNGGKLEYDEQLNHVIPIKEVTELEKLQKQILDVQDYVINKELDDLTKGVM